MKIVEINRRSQKRYKSANKQEATAKRTVRGVNREDIENAGGNQKPYIYVAWVYEG